MICRACQAENDSRADVCFTCGASLHAGFTVTRGTLIGGRYEILTLLGSGGMGTVYKARDRVLEETLALKTLRPEVARDPDVARRFVSETKLARKVRHPNVCAIHEFGEDRGLRFLAMEFVEGLDLRQVLKERGPLPAELAFDIALQVTRGLQAIHHAGVIHRDLKSPNIMRDRRGRVRVMDFGIAKQSGSDTTLGGQVVGTPEYMSPEQARGRKVDFRADLYALGVVIYEIFTGRVPFKGDTPIATILKHLNEPPPLHGPEAAALPAPLLPILECALAKEPAERFESTDAMLAALQSAFAECCPAAAAAAIGATPTTASLRGPAIAARQRLAVESARDGSALRAPAAHAEPLPTPVPATTVVPVAAAASAAAGTKTPASGWRRGAAAAGAGVLLVTAAGTLWWQQRTATDGAGAPAAAPATLAAQREPAPTSPPATLAEAPVPAAAPGPADAGRSAAAARPPDVPARPIARPRGAATASDGSPAGPGPGSATAAAVSPAVPHAEAPAPAPAAAQPAESKPAGAAALPTENPARPALPSVNPSRSTPPRTADVVQPGPGVRDAERISAPRPSYPELARRLRRSALVVVRALVDENGRVAQTEIVTADGSDLGFNESAVEAVRTLRFRPALKNGTPARMWVEVPVRFTP